MERVRRVPAWALSLFAALVSAGILAFLNNYIEVPLTYIIWSLLLVAASFLICIPHSRYKAAGPPEGK
ncbi:MAG: hypothetical protein MUP53_09120 [Bacteroidales bacterium]|nr:hypothetical protein [Bacteroidales bacterium]